MVKIISDSTCDLSQALLDRYNITLLPLMVRLGDELYEDRVNITPDEIYQWSDRTKQAPSTACANVWTIQQLYKQHLKTHEELIVFSISSQMSSTYANMVEAAAEMGATDRIHVVDSRNLSTGIGLLVLEAAEMAQAGHPAADILPHLQQLIPLVRASFVVDTLTFLHRGGRCSGAAALVGSVLKLHPKIVVSDGAMLVDKKYRGSLERSITTYVQDMRDDLLHARRNRVFITHSGCTEALLSQVRTQLEELHYFSEILETRAGGVISCHCGPSTLGVLFIQNET